MSTQPYTIRIVCLFTLIAAPVLGDESGPPIFERDIYPILAKHCAGCHFPEAEKLKGDFDLSTAALTIEGGETADAVIPGKPDESPLVRSIEHTHEPHMPPPDKFPKLDDASIALIREWIVGGALSDPSIATKPPVLDSAPNSLSVANAPISALAFLAANDDLLLAQGSLGKVTVSKLSPALGALETVIELVGHAEMVRALAVSPDGKFLAASGGKPGVGGEIRIWSTVDWSEVRQWSGHRDNILATAFSPDGSKLATASYDKTTIIWDAASGEPIHELKDHVDAVYAIAFGPDGQHLATGAGDRAVKIWDVASGRMLITITDALKAVHAIAYSPDGSRLATAGADKMIRVYEAVKSSGTVNQSDFSSANLVASSFAHDGSVLRLTYSPDGATLFSSSEDRLIKAWDTADLSERFAVEPQPDWPVSLAASGDGATIAVGRYDGTIGVYAAATGDALGASKATEKKIRNPNVEVVIIRATVPPSISSISPSRLHRGGEFTLNVRGKNLDKAKPVIFAKGITAEILEIEAKPEPTLESGKSAQGTGANIVDNARPYVLKMKINVAEDAPLGSHAFLVETSTGLTNSQTLNVVARPDFAETATEDGAPQAVEWPATVAGKIGVAGELDRYAIHTEVGDELVFALTDTKLTSSIRLLNVDGTVLADSSGIASPTADRLGYAFTEAGDYVVEIGDRDLRGGLGYRLHIGEFPWVVQWWPLGIPSGGTHAVNVVGFNLGGDRFTVDGPNEAKYGTRVALPIVVPEGTPISLPRLSTWDAAAALESEPNNLPNESQPIPVPGVADGRFDTANDDDLYRVSLAAGELVYIETEAARLGSPVDTFIDVLTASGDLLQRGVIRCVARTQLTLNDRDSRQSGLRVASWNDLTMGDFVMIGSEVIQVFDLPDYGDEDVAFTSYPNGQRRGYFGTTPEHHAVDSSIYKIEVHEPGKTFASNGMPTFPLYWRNDDGFFGDGSASGDSFIEFVPPSDGDYIVRVREARGLAGPNRAYRLTVRKPSPDFDIVVSPYRVNVSPGSRVPVDVRVRRKDGFDGPVVITAHDLPDGFALESGTVLAGEDRVKLGLVASVDARSTPLDASFRLTGEAKVGDKAVTREAKLGSLTVSEVQPDLLVTHDQTTVSLAPGTSSRVAVHLDRFNGFDGRVPIDVKNLPYGVRILDTGLNGILVREGEFDRSMELYAEPWVTELSRTIYIEARIETSSPQPHVYLSEPIELSIRGTIQTAAGNE